MESKIDNLNENIYLHVSCFAHVGTESRIWDTVVAMNGTNLTKLRKELKKAKEESLGVEINGLPTIISMTEISERLYNMLNSPNK